MTSSKSQNAAGRPSAQPVAIVIDDSDVDREVMMDILRAGGLVVHGLPTPIGATRVARETGARVVVVDQNLPAMDGNKLTGLFRANRALKNIRVVLVSGSDQEMMVDVAREANADAFVSKADLETDLMPTIRRLLTY